MQLNIYAVVLLFAFAQGIIYTILLIRRGLFDERKSDFWLAALILAATIFNLPWMLGFMGIHILGQAWSFLPQSVDLVIGPLIYYYLKSQINIDFQFKKRDFWHFLPYIVYFCYHFLIFCLGKDTVDWWNNTVHTPFFISYFETVLGTISPCIYIGLSWHLYQQYRRWLPGERSDIEQVAFNWYRNFLWALIIAIVSAIVYNIAGIWISLSYWDIWVQRAVIAVIIYYISIAGYAQRQPRQLVFDQAIVAALPTNILAEKTNTTSYKEAITDIEAWQLKIEQIMHADQLYLQPELSLSQLAALLNTHPTLISNIINAAFDKNFNDFVNAFRVAAFQKKVNDPRLQHLTLLAIAFECGFNSKSTFNRAVKKVTGRQPSDFVQRTNT